MEAVSDYSSIDIAANPISDAGSFFLLVPPFIFEQWTSYWTPDISADGHTFRVNTEAGLLTSCGATTLQLLTLVFVCQYSVLFSGTLTEGLRRSTLKTLSLISMTRNSLSSRVRPQAPCTGQHSLGHPQYAEFLNLRTVI